jgi:ABC-2 type transport system permease protein
LAHVARNPGATRLSIAAQIRLIAGLRWRILRNHLRRKSSKLDLIGLAWAALFASTLVLGLSFAFVWGAYFSLSTGHFEWLLLLFWSIFLFWQVFPIFVAGFGATFEFRTLLRFPLSLTAFYLVGLAYGLADFAAIASILWLIAITIGVGLADPVVVPGAFFIVILFVLMNVTFERLLGSWLERLLARRRTRELLLGLFVLLSVSVQFIRPAITRYVQGSTYAAVRYLPYLSPFPPSLAGHAVAAAASGRASAFLWSTVGLLVYIGAFSALLWRRFAAQYRGEQLSETAAPARAPVGVLALEGERRDALRFFSPQVAAVLRKEFRYLSRNGFVLISLLMAPILVLLFTSQFGGRHPSVTHRAASTEMFFPGMMGYLILMLMTPAYNCFAYDGAGIQSYFMAPVRFREVLLGKNLMHAAVLVFEIAVSMTVLAFRIGLPSTPVLLATLAAVVFAVAGQFAIADWTSLGFPRKLEFGSMRGQRSSGISIWIAFGVQIFLAGVCALILFAGRWTNNPWLPAQAFTVLSVASVAGYFAALDALSDVAEKKKETLIEVLAR